MPKQLMIYDSPKPIRKDTHGDLSVQATQNFGFAADLHAVPVMVTEIVAAARDYPVVFTSGDTVMPVAVMGLRPNSNLYVGADGSWEGRYVPAFLRQYPFVLAHSDKSDVMTLCVDESYEGLNREGRGERLFDSAGARTQYLEGVLNFSQQYRTDYAKTESFSKELLETGLLEPFSAALTAGGQTIGLDGFQAVSRAKLAELSDEAAAKLFRRGGLEVIYAHLHGLDHLHGLAQRLADKEGRSTDAPTKH